MEVAIQEEKIRRPDPPEVLEAKTKYTKDNPHETGAYWVPEENKWRGYTPKKGVAPPWMPFDSRRRDAEKNKHRITINERKFLMIYSQTGSATEAWKAVYKYNVYQDKRLEDGRIRMAAKRKIDKIRKKAPELTEAFLFEDVTPDYIKKEMMKLYNHEHATIGEKLRALELMGKTHAMFTEKVISDVRIKESVKEVYKESESDFSSQGDQRLSRLQTDKNLLDKIGVS